MTRDLNRFLGTLLRKKDEPDEFKLILIYKMITKTKPRRQAMNK